MSDDKHFTVENFDVSTLHQTQFDFFGITSHQSFATLHDAFAMKTREIIS